MIKIVALWLFFVGILIDIPICLLQYFDFISWPWALILAIPVLLSIGGALAFAIIYGVLKMIVTLIMLF